MVLDAEDLIDKELKEYLVFDEQKGRNKTRTPVPRENYILQHISEEEAVLQRADATHLLNGVVSTEEESTEDLGERAQVFIAPSINASKNLGEFVSVQNNDTDKNKQNLLDIEELPEFVLKKETPQQEVRDLNRQRVQYKVPLYSLFFIIVCCAGLLLWAVLHHSNKNPTDDTIQVKPIKIRLQKPKEEQKSIEQWGSIEFNPFTIELENAQDDSNLLFLTIAVTAKDAKIIAEIKRKEIIIRDAIFRYLKKIPVYNKKIAVANLNTSIANIVNTHLTTGKISSVEITNMRIQ